MKSILLKLTKRRQPCFGLVYAFSGVVLFLIGITGVQYGAAYFYWPLSVLCFSLLFYPTLFAWGLISGLYNIAALVYIGFTIKELITKGSESTIYSDGMLYFIYIFVITMLSVGLLCSKLTLPKG